MTVLADPHQHEIDRSRAQRRLVPGTLGVDVGRIPVDVLDVAGTQRNLDPLANPSPETGRVVFVEADVLVHVEHGDLVPRDRLIGQRRDEIELGVAGRGDHPGTPPLADRAHEALPCQLRTAGSHRRPIGVDLDPELSDSVTGDGLGHRCSSVCEVRSERPYRCGRRRTADGLYRAGKANPHRLLSMPDRTRVDRLHSCRAGTIVEPDRQYENRRRCGGVRRWPPGDVGI